MFPEMKEGEFADYDNKIEAPEMPKTDEELKRREAEGYADEEESKE